MRLLLLGNTGQLGWELERSLCPLGEITAIDFPDLDMSNPENIRRWVQEVEPAVIVNATAYTNVDKAEEQPELAMAINGTGPGVLAEEARLHQAALIHFSTDYVFDGRETQPYREEDQPNPLGMYGRSKLEGERAVEAIDDSFLIFRTAWVYSLRRPSFVTKVLEWSRRQQTLRVVTDQVSNPTWCRSLAEATASLLARAGRNPAAWIQERKGLYHLAGWGYASRIDLAKAVLRCDPAAEEQVTEKLEPALSREFPSPVERPLFSALNCEKFEQTFDLRLPDWEKALKLAMVS